MIEDNHSYFSQTLHFSKSKLCNVFYSAPNNYLMISTWQYVHVVWLELLLHLSNFRNSTSFIVISNQCLWTIKLETFAQKDFVIAVSFSNYFDCTYTFTLDITFRLQIILYHVSNQLRPENLWGPHTYGSWRDWKHTPKYSQLIWLPYIN